MIERRTVRIDVRQVLFTFPGNVCPRFRRLHIIRDHMDRLLLRSYGHRVNFESVLAGESL